MSEKQNPAFLQGAANLRAAADMPDARVGPMPAAAAPKRSALAVAAKAREADAGRTPPSHTCCQRLKLSFYFDGTGNNRDADLPTYEHSNVARMFRAAPDDSGKDGVYSFYVPGLGTYFMDINDHGESEGKAFARRGEDRLQWALKKLQERRSAVSKLVGIDIAVFGFSRGAALARAFANRVQKLCEASHSGGWVLKGSNVAVDIYFMGLWDTVASVGLPKSVNNQTKLELLLGAVGGDAVSPQRHMAGRDVATIAYGRPGADPAPSGMWSWADGHMGWGAEMAIPAIVSKGVHMMAGHEMRNSFPVDSTMQGGQQASAFAGDEYIYPGVHSDVGGGYRPGEGGRSSQKGRQLSVITLRVMYDKARAAGVPLGDINDEAMVRPDIRLDFALALPSDPEPNHAAAREYAEMERLWNRYMDFCGRGARPMGQWFLAHMKAYYAWRFWNIRKNNSERAASRPTDDDLAAKPIEEQSRREQAELEKKIGAEENSPGVQQARRDTGAARFKLQQAQARLSAAQQSSSGWMVPMNAEQAQQFAAQRAQEIASYKAAVADARSQLTAAEQAQNLAEDPMRRLQAQKDTLPSQGTLHRNWQQYDDRLYADAKQLSENKLMKRWLRPHYRALVQAWEDEFVNNKGVINNDVMKFFANYVHDSLADFAKDATLPSDPRVVYVGGDEIELFAINSPMAVGAEVQAA